MKTNKLLFIYSFLLTFTGVALCEDLPKTRPNEIEGPTKVQVSLFFVNVDNINSRAQSFTLDFVVRLNWHDDRLKDIKGPASLNSIWQPNVQIYNVRDVEIRLPEQVIITEDGLVQYTQRYYATLSSPLDFREFPFNEQILPISLLAFGYTPEDVELVFESAGSERKFSISDWSIEAVGPEQFDYAVDLFDNSDMIVRSRLDFELKANRYIDYYWWKVLAPLLVILFLSWAVFWINPIEVGAQIGVSGTSILALIAFLYKLDNDLPPVSYLTHMDHFIFTTLILVFGAYLEALISTTSALKGKQKFAHKLDFIFRVIYPPIFFTVVFIYWVR